ncbi:DUF1573 domain-containing protein [Desulfuromonas thiophila]|uniref:DUF1573 domain-containing protein n=1 Tax=Desulfuromonas thiophila TaxID=57664 RepID=A0A1G7BHB0_9BACT|nr:DUF1573 domain-containing protein [Desulfuromonas thiophila]SDE26383.1 hypothetical protein SAMN05661003_10642 [Desulfuromonas thiophila]
MKPRMMAALFGLLLASPLWAAPVARFDSNRIDWGTVYEGQVVEQRFVLHNDGDDPLQIGRIRSG